MANTDHVMEYWLGIIGQFRKIANSPMGVKGELKDYTTGDAWWYYNKQHHTIMPMSSANDIPTPVESSAKMFGDASRWFYLGKTHNGIITETFENEFA